MSTLNNNTINSLTESFGLLKSGVGGTGGSVYAGWNAPSSVSDPYVISLYAYTFNNSGGGNLSDFYANDFTNNAYSHLNVNNLAASDTTVAYNADGIGVQGKASNLSNAPTQQINYDPVTGNSETLLVNLNHPVSDADVSISHLFRTENLGEYGSVFAYDANGNEVGSFIFGASNTNLGLTTGVQLTDAHGITYTFDALNYDVSGKTVSADDGTLDINASMFNNADFQYLAFQAVPYGVDLNPTKPLPVNDSSDYFLQGVTATYVLSSLFTAGNDNVDFNAVQANTYIAGTQYNSLAGDDTVILPSTKAAADASGYAYTSSAGNDGSTIYTLSPFTFGSGTDSLTYNAVNFDPTSNNIFTQATVNGGGGTDTLNIDGSNLGSIALTPNGNSSATQSLLVADSFFNITANNISNYHIDETAINNSDSLTVYGQGNDSFAFNTGDGATATTQLDNAVIQTDNIANFEFVSGSFTGNSLAVQGGNVFQVESDPTGDSLGINVSNGVNTYSLTADNITTYTFDGGSSNNQLSFDEYEANNNYLNDYLIGSNSITLGTAQFAFNNIQQISIDGAALVNYGNDSNAVYVDTLNPNDASNTDQLQNVLAVDGSAQDDTFVYDPNVTLNGELGLNTLLLNSSNVALNLDLAANITNFGVIDLGGAGSNHLTVSTGDIEHLNPTSSSLIISSENSDNSITFNANPSVVGNDLWSEDLNPVIIAGEDGSYNKYTNADGETMYIQSDAAVTINGIVGVYGTLSGAEFLVASPDNTFDLTTAAAAQSLTGGDAIGSIQFGAGGNVINVTPEGVIAGTGGADTLNISGVTVGEGDSVNFSGGGYTIGSSGNVLEVQSGGITVGLGANIGYNVPLGDGASIQSNGATGSDMTILTGVNDNLSLSPSDSVGSSILNVLIANGGGSIELNGQGEQLQLPAGLTSVTSQIDVSSNESLGTAVFTNTATDSWLASAVSKGGSLSVTDGETTATVHSGVAASVEVNAGATLAISSDHSSSSLQIANGATESLSGLDTALESVFSQTASNITLGSLSTVSLSADDLNALTSQSPNENTITIANNQGATGSVVELQANSVGTWTDEGSSASGTSETYQATSTGGTVETASIANGIQVVVEPAAVAPVTPVNPGTGTASADSLLVDNVHHTVL